MGILATRAGMSVLQAVILSVANLTSAGQAAGIEVIAAGGTLLEIAVTQFVINIRYSLMGMSLSQKLAPSFGVPQRLLASYGITDEVFGVSSAHKGLITPPYMYGMIITAASGWALGTLLGAVAGEALPASVTNALGILLYGMFIAIVVPVARKERHILIVVVIAICCSVIFRYLIPSVTGGFAVIFSSLIAAVAGAILFPLPEAEEETE